MKLLKKRDVLKYLSYDGKDVPSDRLSSLFKDRIKALPTFDIDEIREDIVKRLLNSTSKDQELAYAYVLSLINKYLENMEDE